MDRRSFIGRLHADTSPRSDPKSPDVEDDQSGVSLFFALLFTIAPYEKAEGGSKLLSKASWLADASSTELILDPYSYGVVHLNHLSIRYPLSLFVLRVVV